MDCGELDALGLIKTSSVLAIQVLRADLLIEVVFFQEYSL